MRMNGEVTEGDVLYQCTTTESEGSRDTDRTASECENRLVMNNNGIESA